VISNTSCLSVWQNAFVCGTWLLHMCDSGLPVWHDAFICATEFLRAWFQIVCTSEKLYMPSITMHVSNVVTRFHPLCYQSWHTRQIWSIPEILHLPNDIMYMSNIVIYMSNIVINISMYISYIVIWSYPSNQSSYTPKNLSTPEILYVPNIIIYISNIEILLFPSCYPSGYFLQIAWYTKVVGIYSI